MKKPWKTPENLVIFPLKNSQDFNGIQFHSDFSKGGGHTVSNMIVMAFSPWNIVGRLLKKKAYKGGVMGTPRPPSLCPCYLKH